MKCIWIPTWNCNLTCSYCDYRVKDNTLYTFDKTIKLKESITPTEWIDIWNKYPWIFLEMTGGEPMFKKGISEILNNIDNNWAITSNSLCTNEIKQLDFKNCIGWTSSYHNTNEDTFINNIKFIKEKGIPVAITFVITPDNWQHMFDKMRDYKNLGFRINVHPILKQGFNWAEHEELWNKINELPYNIIKIDKKWEKKTYPMCSAGTNYFMMFPDGDYYRCYAAHLNGDKKMGNVRDTLDLLESKTPCNRPCSFPCDQEIAER